VSRNLIKLNLTQNQKLIIADGASITNVFYCCLRTLK